MKKILLVLALVLIPALSFAVTDQQVREMIVKESLQSYPGNCPCPYNTMRNGRSCGGRSAYSWPAGRSVSTLLPQGYLRSDGQGIPRATQPAIG